MTPRPPKDAVPSADHLFQTVESDEIGYEPTHVDAFMERAREAAEGRGELTPEQVRQARFATVDGGYATDEVDDALDRLEEALTAAERDAVVREHGDGEWDAALEESTRELLDRADRAPAERFRRPTREDAPAYAIDDVDALLDRLRATLGSTDRVTAERGDAADRPLTADDVRRSSFAEAEGRDGYDEAQVDVYLDAAVDVLLRRG